MLYRTWKRKHEVGVSSKQIEIVWSLLHTTPEPSVVFWCPSLLPVHILLTLGVTTDFPL